MTEDQIQRPSRRALRFLCASAIIGALAITSMPAFAQNEEILVTARKVEENIQDVPISITAFSGETFENAGLTEFSDLAKITPNFNILPNGAAGPTFSNITLRGQTAGFLTLNADQAVGIYINGAPVTRGTALTNLFDVERVEVLKGPQGTLYGKNTTGGAVSIVTKAPEFNELGGYTKFTLGNYDRTDAEMVANIPLVDDKLAVRVGAALSHRDGYGRGLTSGRQLADDNELTLRASVLFEPTDKVSLRINADYHDQDEAGPIIRSLRSVFGGFLALKTADPDIYVGNDLGISPSFTRSKDWNLNGTLSVDLGGATLNSITSYRDQVASLGYQASPATGVALAQDSHIFAQELRFNGSALNDLLDWQIGAFYSNESGFDEDFIPGFGIFQTTAAKNEGWSVFTQNSFSITDALRLTAGLRYTDEDRQVRDLTVGAPIASANASFSGWTWLASLDYKITPDVLVYVSNSRGFRSGGIDQDKLSTIVRPETLTNYEIGLKADLWDNKLRFNAAGYYSKYKDIQRTSFDPANFPVTILRNAAKATLKGFELETTVTPVPGLTLSGTLGHTDGKYDEFVDGPLNRSDEPIGGPKWQYSLSGRYEVAVSDKANLEIQANYFWIGETTLTSPGVSALLPADEGALAPYGLLNAQVDLDLDVLNGLNIAVFGTNILDKRYYSGGIVVPIVRPTEIVSNRFSGEPATYGIRIKKSF